jgi:hypothetical protein
MVKCVISGHGHAPLTAVNSNNYMHIKQIMTLLQNGGNRAERWEIKIWVKE